MAGKGKTVEEQAAIASLKELRARDAALATREYQQERQELAARTEKLRALRLARERELVANPLSPAGRKVAPKKAADRRGDKG